jgi:hypothetical protein
MLKDPTVTALLVTIGALENAPDCVAGVESLAVRTSVPPIVTV